MYRLPLIASLMVTVLAACAPAQEVVSTPSQDDRPQPGGIVYLAVPAGPETIDPYFTAGGGAVSSLQRLIYDGLLDYKQETPDDDFRASFTPVPWLAEKWTIENPTTYLFSLRKDVKWHDGTPFTAVDVVFSYERMLNPENRFRNRGLIGDVQKIEAVDSQTVRMTRKEPSAEFLANLASSPALAILPKHVADRGDDFKKVAIGTGPFKLQAFDSIKGASLGKNAAYWQAGKPYVDGVRLFYGLDRSGLIAAMVAKNSDFYNVPDKGQFDTIKGARPDMQFKPYHIEYNYGGRYNITKPPFNDIRVRRAMHLAVDRQEMLQIVTFGLGGINQHGAPSIVKDWAIPDAEFLAMPGIRQPKDPDMAEAKRLLAEAGYPNGFKTTLNFYSTNSSQRELAEALSGYLRRIGVDAVLGGTDEAVARKNFIDGAYEITLSGGSVTVPPDNVLRNEWHSKGPINKSGVNDPVLDDLIDKQSVALDPAERAKILLAINRRITEQQYFLPLVAGAYFTAWQPYVKNLYLNYAGQAWFRRPADIWIDPAAGLPSGRSLETR